MKHLRLKLSKMLSRSFTLFRKLASLVPNARYIATAKSLDISGVYPPISTPFDSHENIAYDKLEANLRVWNEAPFRGYVVQGSNGEYVYLSTEERVEMVKRVRQLVPKEKLILAGSGCESTRDTIQLSKKMADAGANAVLVTTPCFYKSGMTNEAMVAHYTKVADESLVPVILYSVPSNTGIDLAPEAVIKLSSHPNIVGLKDSGGDIGKIGNLIFKTKGIGFQILAGSASFLYPAVALGSVGGVCALANVLPQEVCQLYELCRYGNHEDAQALQQRLISPNAAVTRRFGVPGLKLAMDWFGFYGGPTRSPLQALTQEEAATLKRMFTDSGFQGHA